MAARRIGLEEVKRPRQTGFTNKPSDKLARKVADPFRPKKKNKTNFGYVYTAGGIPCRIFHQSVSMKLQWDVEPSQLPYDPLLITCFEGLLETEHPYSFVSRKAIEELLMADGAADKTIPLIQRLVMPLRAGLMAREAPVFTASLEALKLLVEVVGPHMNDHLHLIIQQIAKKINDRQLRDKVFEVLSVIEEQGGPDVLPIIKKKIPTYNTQT